MNKYSRWISKLGKAWIDRKPEMIPPLFVDKFEYYETPFEKPYTTKEGLVKLWNEVPDSQKDVKFVFDILAIKNNTAIAHWLASFTRTNNHKKAVLDGIFLIKLNRKGLCTLFRQWWVTKE